MEEEEEEEEEERSLITDGERRHVTGERAARMPPAKREALTWPRLGGSKRLLIQEV